MKNYRRYRRFIALFMSFLLVASFFVRTGHAEAGETVLSAFADMKSHWAESQVSRLASKSIIAGFPDGTYRPDEPVTREQFVSMMMRTLGYRTDNAAASGFADVAADRWSFGAIAAAVQSGMVQKEDYVSGFQPGAPVSRNEMAVMIARALKLAPNEDALFFQDKSEISAHPELVGATVNAQIISGFPDQTFRPNNTLTRAQAAVVLIGTLDAALQSTDPDVPTPMAPRNASNSVAYQPGVVELGDEGRVQSLAADGTLTLSGDASNVKAGNIVVLPPSKEYPFGVARKIVTVTSDGTLTAAKTEEPAFTDVIDRIDVQKETPVLLDDLDESSVPEGVTVRKLPKKEVTASALNVKAGKDFEGLEFEISSLKIKPFENSDMTLELSGKIRYGTPNVIVDYDYSWFKVNQLHLEFSSTNELDTAISYTAFKEEASASYSVGNAYKGFDLKAFGKDITLGDFYIPVAGPLGVQASIVLQLKVDASGVITESVKTTFIQDFGIMKEDGEYKPINKSKYDVEVEGKGKGKIGARLGLEAKLAASVLHFANAGLRASGGIQGQAEVSVGIAASGEAGGDLTTGEITGGADLKLSGCYRYGIDWYASAGAYIQIPLVLNLDFPIVDKTWPIKNHDSCAGKDWAWSGEASPADGAAIVKLEAQPGHLKLKPGSKQTVALKAATSDGTVREVDWTKVQYSTNGNGLITFQADGSVLLSDKAKAGDAGQITFTYEGQSVTVQVEADVPTADEPPAVTFEKTVRTAEGNPVETVQVQQGQHISITITNHNMITYYMGSTGQPITTDNPTGVFVGAFLVNGKYVANNDKLIEKWFMVNTPDPGHSITMDLIAAISGPFYIGYNGNDFDQDSSYTVSITLK